jgi:hypothetical protein
MVLRLGIRRIGHEWTLVSLGALVLAVIMTWPAMRDPRHTIAGDLWDPSLEAWQMAWAGWAVKHDPGQLWQTNAFHSERYAFAYSDTLLGYLPAGLIGNGMSDALLRYNVMFVLVFALAFVGAYALTRQLGASIPGAAVAGAAFAYAPWRWTQDNHLHVLSTGGVALALAMLARGHGYSFRHGYRPELVKPGWALAGWLVAAWQMTIGFGIGLPFAYALGLITLVTVIRWWRRRRPVKRRLLAFDAAGAIAFLAVSAAMAYPYLKMISIYPYGRRNVAEIKFFSPAFLGFFTAPNTDLVWGAAHTPLRNWLYSGHGGLEAVLLPGFVLYVLAGIGLFVNVWSRRQRITLAVALVVVGTLAMGLRAPITALYRAMLIVLPGWDAVRTPGRLVVWITLLLAVLAAGAVTAFGERSRPGWTVVFCVLVLVEGIQTIPAPSVPRPPVAFAQLEGPVLVLPSNYKDDELAMLWSTDGFVALQNGSSGLLPAGLVKTREVTATFPDVASVAYLRGLGVRTVLVLRRPNALHLLPQPPPGTQVPPNAVDAPVADLGVTREVLPDVVIFRI